MIYIIFFLTTLFCIVRFDFCITRNDLLKKRTSKFYISKRRFLFFVLFVLMVLYTALSYRVGSDIGRYMYDFEHIRWSDFDFKKISLSDRQPLWILFQLISKSILDNFVFFRLLSSSLVLYAFYKYIYDETPLLFSSLIFFFILMSFDINFNILRQALAIASFIVSCRYIKKRKYVKSLFFILISVLFHNSAFVLLIVPLLCLIDVKKHFNIYFCILSIICIAILYLPQDNFAFNLLFMSNDETLSTLSSSYLSGEYGTSSFSLIKMIIHLILFYFIAKFYNKSGASSCDLMFLYLYIFFFIASASIPIMGRIKYYFTIFYVIAVPKSIFYFLREFNVRNLKLVYLIAISMFLFNPTRYYFLENPRINVPNGIQYYPYYSVFNPRISPERERIVEY